MDRKIEKKRFTTNRIVTVTGLVIATSIVFWLLQGPGVRDTFRVDRSRLTISTVTSGAFEDFIPVRGRVTEKNEPICQDGLSAIPLCVHFV